MKAPIVCCSNCRGTGKLPLSPPLLETLTIIKNFGSISIPEIHKGVIALGGSKWIVATAINKRVTKLLQLKLVSKKVLHGQSFYSVAK